MTICIFGQSPCLQLDKRAVSGHTGTTVVQHLPHVEGSQRADHQRPESTVLSVTRVSLQ